MLGNNSKIQIKVTGKKDNEVILFAHDPNRDISTGNQIGSFGIPTRITFRAPRLYRNNLFRFQIREKADDAGSQETIVTEDNIGFEFV
ncbi:unnamed protein product [Trichobilharzia regenti]|nr:unnamed protein product [Trichobilharzia regenti]